MKNEISVSFVAHSDSTLSKPDEDDGIEQQLPEQTENSETRISLSHATVSKKRKFASSPALEDTCNLSPRPKRVYARYTTLTEQQKLPIVCEYLGLKKSQGIVAADGDRSELPIFRYLWEKNRHLGQNNYERFRLHLLKWVRNYKLSDDNKLVLDRRKIHSGGSGVLLCQEMRAELQRQLRADLQVGVDVGQIVVMRRAHKLFENMHATGQAGNHQKCCLRKPYSHRMADREIDRLCNEGLMKREQRKLNPGDSSRTGIYKRAACLRISDIVRENLERERPSRPATEVDVPYIREQMQSLLAECKANDQHTACCVEPDKFTWKMAYDVRRRWKEADAKRARAFFEAPTYETKNEAEVQQVNGEVTLEFAAPPPPISDVNLLQLLSHAFYVADSCMQLLSGYSSFGMVSSVPGNVRLSIATMLRGVKTQLEAVDVIIESDDTEADDIVNVPLSTLNNCLTMMKQTSQTMSLVSPRMLSSRARTVMMGTVNNLVRLCLGVL